MNGAHDLGGMDGFGPVLTEADEPMFHAQWERRAFAITLAAGMLGRWNIDMARFAREDTDPLTYLRSTYYEQWLRGLERLLVEKGLVSANELASGKANGVSNVAPVPAERVPAVLLKGATARRVDAGPARFSLGEAVRVRNLHPRGHTRMPRYCRDKLGMIERDHGTYVFPDSHAASGEERPQRCYAVSFTLEALWGEGASRSDRVLIDLWDDYLEPV